jgi:hypothetical protein
MRGWNPPVKRRHRDTEILGHVFGRSAASQQFLGRLDLGVSSRNGKNRTLRNSACTSVRLGYTPDWRQAWLAIDRQLGAVAESQGVAVVGGDIETHQGEAADTEAGDGEIAQMPPFDVIGLTRRNGNYSTLRIPSCSIARVQVSLFWRQQFGSIWTQVARG